MTHPNGETVLTAPNIPRRFRVGLREALGNAIASAFEHGADMPVGAVTMNGKHIVGVGYASDRRLENPLLHAEAMAIIDSAGEPFDTLVSTLEPCTQCQDFIAGHDHIKQVAYGLPRTEASDRGLIRAHEESAAERVARLGLPFEVIRLDDSLFRNIGRNVLDSVTRDPDTQRVQVDTVRLLRGNVDLNKIGHSL